ncbi:unnamed protein product [Amoebophrya sp. A25]|nr:unnamed protein product [Amoebophrya sp. A25]|eukprot:GSA25T00003892001.1
MDGTTEGPTPGLAADQHQGGPSHQVAGVGPGGGFSQDANMMLDDHNGVMGDEHAPFLYPENYDGLGSEEHPLLHPLHAFTCLTSTWGNLRSFKEYPGDWEMIKQLGIANFGRVYLYKHVPTGENMVVKRMATDERNADGHIAKNGVLERYTYKGEGENPVIEIGAYTYISFGRNVEEKFALMTQMFGGESKSAKSTNPAPEGEGPGDNAECLADVLGFSPDVSASPRAGSCIFRDVVRQYETNCPPTPRAANDLAAGYNKAFVEVEQVESADDPAKSKRLSIASGETDVQSTREPGTSTGKENAYTASITTGPSEENPVPGAVVPPGYPQTSAVGVDGHERQSLQSGSAFSQQGGSSSSSFDPAAAVGGVGGVSQIASRKISFTQHERCPYILSLRGVLMDTHHVYVLTEPCARGELFEMVSHAKRLSEDLTRTYMRQICTAVSWLHQRGIGHRDISLENILLTGEPDDRCIRLMDFGMACNLYREKNTARDFEGDLTGRRDASTSTWSETRGKYHLLSSIAGGTYDGSSGKGIVACRPEWEDAFYTASVGKDLYRPPELYHQHSAQSQGPDVPQKPGYRVAPVDVFCVGVCFFMMLTGKPLWKRCTLSDKVTAFLADGGSNGFDANWSRLVDGWGFRGKFSEDALDLIPKMIHFDPDRRWSIDQVCQHRFFLADGGPPFP